MNDTLLVQVRIPRSVDAQIKEILDRRRARGEIVQRSGLLRQWIADGIRTEGRKK